MLETLPMTQTTEDAVVTCFSADGVQFRAGVVSLSSSAAVLEIYTPQAVVRSSEILTGFKINVGDHIAYSGKAVVRSHVSSGLTVICEVELEEGWLDASSGVAGLTASTNNTSTGNYFLRAASQSQAVYPEVKIAVADLLNFLLDLRRWSEQVEFRLRCASSGQRKDLEREELKALDKVVTPALIRLFERFETAAESITPELRANHGRYIKRLLHPLVLCSPFMYRSFQKPLGYAGDYEMVKMMLGERFQGGSVFAKILNSYFLSTPPVVAHQNRISYLVGILQDEACRCRVEGGNSRFFSLGCGPAIEVQEFLARSELSNSSQFTLIDFSSETIEYTSATLERVRALHHRTMTVECVNKSVIQLLKESGKTNPALSEGGVYDVVYCAGLFDYLADPVCERLMNVFYKMLVPGGLLVATNVFAENPSRQWMEYSVDWHLIHRDRARMLAICPKEALQSACNVKCDPIGLNLFLEIRKPKDV